MKQPLQEIYKAFAFLLMRVYRGGGGGVNVSIVLLMVVKGLLLLCLVHWSNILICVMYCSHLDLFLAVVSVSNSQARVMGILQLWRLI